MEPSGQSTNPISKLFTQHRLRKLSQFLVLAAVLCVGILLRLRLLHSDRGELLADEAFTGLLSAEIVRGYFPLIISAIGYTAPIESYLFIPLMQVFGMSVVALKMTSTLLWLTAGVVITIGARQILGKGPALVAGIVVWMPMGALLVISFRAYDGYSSGLATFALLSVVALHSVNKRHTTVRTTDSFLIGCTAGLLLWIHPVYLTVAVPVVAVVAVVHRRAFRNWWIPAITGGFLGSSLLLAWNLKNDFLSFRQPAVPSESLGDRFKGLLTELVPRVLGVRTYGNAWIFPRFISLIVLIITISLIVIGIRKLLAVDRQIAAVVIAPLVAGLPLLTLLHNASFTDDARYGIVFVVPIALAVGAASRSQHRQQLAPALRMWSVLTVWILAVVLPWSFKGVTYGVTNGSDHTERLIELVQTEGYDRLSGYYWSVLPVEYMSQQEIRVSVAGHPFTVLLPDTQRLVDATTPERLPLVFLGDPPDALLRMPRQNYKQVALNDLIVFLPVDTEVSGDGQ